SEAHPGLIYASVRGFGDSGPYSSFKAFDPVAQAMGGAMSINGERGAPPLRLGLTLGDTGAGVHCALGIVSAYVQRLRTGRGQRVEISMQEAVVNYARTVIAGAQRLGKPARRDGSRIAIMVPSDLYACAPGGDNDYAYIIVSTPTMLGRLLESVGRPDLAGKPEPSDPKERRGWGEELRAAIGEWTGERDKFTVMETLEGNGVPCGAVLDTSELLANLHLRERGLISTLEHPTLGRIDVPGSPVRLSGSSVEMTPAPLLGQHNREVYAELLDLGEAELAELAEAGVI
ncbi:MAG: CaiB/BaiF CoA transferase family protein, partial [Acidimicrobiia bacterium]